MSSITSDILDRYASILDTRAVIVERDATHAAVDAFQEHLPRGLWIVAVDDNTWEVAGQALGAEFDARDLSWQRWDVPLHDGEEHPMCDDDRVEAFQSALADAGASAGIAVGSGTINDIVKMATYRVGIPAGCIGTAPSMNGFTSAISAILSDGVKTTQPCHAPVVVAADIDVMAESPQRMVQSGLGDLISKPVSNSDWGMSHILNGTPHSAEAMEIIEAGAAMLEGVAPKLPEKDRDAVAGLTESLMLSGFAMAVAGSSSPASGGEHLISHFIDMTAHAYDLTYDFHGCQVGVGTLTSAHFYERFLAMSPEDVDIEAAVARHLPWDEYDAMLRDRFDVLYDAVVKHAEPGYPSADELRSRLQKVVDEWDDIRSAVRATLRTRQQIEDELASCGAPIRFSQLGVERDRAWRAIVHSKDIRNRYTILHLAWELGTLEEWADEALEILWE